MKENSIYVFSFLTLQNFQCSFYLEHYMPQERLSSDLTVFFPCLQMEIRGAEQLGKLGKSLCISEFLTHLSVSSE